MSPTRFSRARLPALSFAFLATLLVSGCSAHLTNGSADLPGPSSPTASPPPTLESRLADAIALADREDHAAASLVVAAVIADPAFDLLSTTQRHQALSAAAFAALLQDELPRARDLYLSATRVDPAADPDDWFRLWLIESDLGDHETAASHLLHLLREWPELLVNFPAGDITRLVHRMAPESPARLEVLQALFDASWTRDGLGASGLWYELALMRVERGEAEAARAAIERITEPMDRVKLRADRRFDAVVDRSDPQFDAAHAARVRVDDLRVMAMLQPERLDVLRELTYALLTAGDNSAVLTMTDAALAVLADGTEISPFQDIDEQVWLMNNRAIALRRLGRIDEALAQLEHASGRTEDGVPNVSQALNLGQFYCSLGRPDDALKAVAHVERMTGYGRMVQTSVQHCAARRSGDSVGAARAMAYLREHRLHSEIHFLEALLEADRLDEATAVIVALLESPHDRADALIAVQKFRTTKPLPGDVAYRARAHQMIARAEVQAAVRRVGRIEHHDIHSGNGTD